jgi:outer membrane protein
MFILWSFQEGIIMHKKILVSLLALLTPVAAMAEAGDWVVRARAVNVSPNEDSKLGRTVNGLGLGNVMSPGAKLEVDSNTIPEVDVSYYFTKHIAAELILALGTRHDVSIHGDSAGVIGNQNLGSVNMLPPTLTLQWHFLPDQKFDPYVGAGVNYTFALDRNLKFATGATQGEKIRIDRDSVGLALQAGFDINLQDGWLINADVKYIWMDTDVEMRSALTGNKWTKIDSLDINPWVVGVGFGKKF